MAGWAPQSDREQEGDHLSDETLSAYLDDAIEDEAERGRVTAHLAQCPSCRQALDELRALVSALRELPEPALPRSFRVTAADLSLQALPAPPAAWYIRQRPLLQRLAAVAAVLLVVVVVADLWVHRATPAQSPMQSLVPEVSGPVAGDTADEAPAASGAPSSVTGAASDDATAAAQQQVTAETGVANQEGPGATETETASSLWRLAELALALALVWLLVAVTILPRLSTRGQ